MDIPEWLRMLLVAGPAPQRVAGEGTNAAAGGAGVWALTLPHLAGHPLALAVALSSSKRGHFVLEYMPAFS